MRILHTSDWHLGRTLYGKKRTREFESFLDWLLDTLRLQKIDTLLVAGDIFDTTTPSNRIQQLYYRFLCRVANTGCRHVVIVGGNHDSPSFLDAPGELLRFLDIHVVGAATEDIADELLVLSDSRGNPELLVCAVPCLRDRDIRCFEAGESVEDKDRKTLEGIRAHYETLGEMAEEKRKTLGSRIPIVATGHLFAAGGSTAEGDGVRDLYIGTLGHVDPSTFPTCIDYLALGHLHSPQKVDDSERMRYCGSPFPMNPAEGEQNKSVTLVTFAADTKEVSVEFLPVPVFQKLKRIAGDLETIRNHIGELRLGGSSAWLEIVYEGQDLFPDLRQRLDVLVAESGMEILRVRINRSPKNACEIPAAEIVSDDLDVLDVFTQCLEARSIPDGQREELFLTYREVLASFDSEDLRSE